MNTNRTLVAIISLALIVSISGVCHSTPDESQGFPALSVASVNVTADQIPKLRDALKNFATVEHLTFFEGGFPKQGRPVHQFYFKQNDQPVFSIDNFRDPLIFEASAYSKDSDDVWKPRWLRLLSTIHAVLGPNDLT
jgi:hypothetical protein